MLTPEVLNEVVRVLSTHDEGEGHWCDTGADMDWACRSECLDAAIRRLRRTFGVDGGSGEMPEADKPANTDPPTNYAGIDSTSSSLPLWLPPET